MMFAAMPLRAKSGHQLAGRHPGKAIPPGLNVDNAACRLGIP